MLMDMVNAKCGEVFMFGGISSGFLDSLENLYNKPITDNQFGAVHTFGIFLTKQEKVKKLWYLLWKPFIGFRWLDLEYVHEAYFRLEKDKGTLKVDLGLEELELKQKDFNKWRGDERTEKLLEYLSREDVTAKFQTLMREIAVDAEAGKYRPKGMLNRMILKRIKDEPSRIPK